MKKSFGREVGLLLLPVVFVGAVVLWKGGKGILPAALDKSALTAGPFRLEYSPFEAVDLTPLDVAHGFSWKAATKVEKRGLPKVPANWVFQIDVNKGDLRDIRLVYRRGKQWKQVEKPKTWSGLFSNNLNISTGTTTLMMNLEKVPKDADEIRLRGRFKQWAYFKGALPSGGQLPQGTRSYGLYHEVPVESKPVDVQIKGAEEPFPAPDVSREPQIELRGSTFVVQNETDRKGKTHAQEVFFLHLHHTENKQWGEEKRVAIQNVHVFDADGHELDLYDDYGTSWAVGRGYGGYNGSWNQEIFSPHKTADDLVTSILNSSVAPKKGWSQVKHPLRFELEVSDGECWPTKLRVQFSKGPRKYEDLEKFGASSD